MGSQQWASGMTDVDKAQLDRIENLSANANFFDKFNPFNEVQKQTINVGTFTIFEVLGEGYFSDCYMQTADVNFTNTYLEIIVDDVLRYRSGFAQYNMATGLLSKEMVSVSGSSFLVKSPWANNAYSVLLDNPTDLIMPIVNNAMSSKPSVLTQPIFFKRNMKLALTNVGVSGIFESCVRGAVK